MNAVQILGNLTRDPELKYSTNGSPVCNFAIAVNRKYKDQEETSFFDLVCFGRTAELVNSHFSKGRRILAEGRLKQERWQDKQTGTNRSKVVVIVDRVHFVDSKGGGQEAATTSDGFSPCGPSGEDIPF